MSFPDQSHINRVRDALWQRSGGGASVMIGSGFSRNALKARPDANDPPTWRDVAKAVYAKLYPQDGDGDSGTATSDFLRLAQEYEAAFGRGDLHRFLGELIRDDDFLPGDLHIRLLSLPWRDVFTTNWDTLLERARTSVADRAYSVVQNMDEIPLANRPRIVKLHGSFPSHFPLIFTEEDYRTYPTKFAPFVNTVQQAMMETVFCLIGFSGDDPNFLQWSGWVRDNLGDAAPKIYLAGWLELSSHRRRMLEDRNVVPIDLALHPKAGEWRDHLRHQYATEWLLHTLERGRPYDVSEWPSRPSWQHMPVPELIQPVEEVVSDEPENELPEKGKGSLLDSVRNILKVWTHNRTIYPGWLAAPASARSLIDWSTRDYESRILGVFSELTPVERLEAIHELVWRWEILLNPISSKLESAAQDVLDLIDCQNRTINGSIDPKIEWGPIRDAWRTVALSLVTAARHSLDHDVFEQRIEALSLFLQDDLDIDHRIHHERCLWAMYSMDFGTLESLLKDWRTENCDPVWMMRKAALLFETGRHDEATKLSEHALSAIREMPIGDLSLAGPSRESWALWLVAQLKDYQMFSKRWNELAPLKCNALTERRLIEDAIKGNGETKEAPSFDLGTRWVSGQSFSNADSRGAAYRAIRLSEVAGLPSYADHMDVAANILKLAADKLSTSDPEMAVRLVLRVSTNYQDKTLMRVLSRTRVAALSADSARTLVEICNSVIEYALPRMVGKDAHGHRPVFWIKRVSIAMEALSRLVLRLESDTAEAIFNKALEHYRNQQVAQDMLIAAPVRDLLKRSWETLPEDRRTARVLDLLSSPIIGVDNFTAESAARYLDPGELLWGDELFLPPRTADNERRWQEVVNLLVRGLCAGGEARERASLRIAHVDLEKRLTETESLQVAQALWSEKYTGPNDLPGETSLLDWVFIPLPAPKSGVGEQRFRRKWLTANSTPQGDAPNLDDILWQVGNAISGLKNRWRSLDLSEDERSYLTEVVKQWSDTPVPVQDFPLMASQSHEPTRHALEGLPSILAEIQIPESIGEKLYNKMKNLDEPELPRFRLIAGLVKTLPNRFDELVSMMRMGLVSDNVDIAEGAAVGLHHWLMVSAEAASQIQPPPNDLVREIGIMIATRRKKALGQALEIAKWVFDEGNDAQKGAIRYQVLQGLGYLVEKLRYDREHDQDDDFDVPLLRWRCTHLALAMAECGLGDDPAVARWSENIENDPLPEVRYASPAFRHQSNHPTEN
ncbi:MAG: SIR2 family protein [Gemmatimonadota bacterium]|nr:SIR2 family protein [Gemmatimonadota bacterium]